jgi:hypothetical protein
MKHFWSNSHPERRHARHLSLPLLLLIGWVLYELTANRPWASRQSV